MSTVESSGSRRPRSAAPRRRAAAILACAITGVVALAPASAGAATDGGLASVGHVWVLELENKGYDATFGPGSAAPYLATTLRAQGQLLTQYYGTGHESLDNYVSQVSGQAPNAQTQADCQLYTDFTPTAPVAPDGQAIGQGCVYPASTQTVADQLSAAGLGWKSYAEDLPSPCYHPPLNQQDPHQSASATSQFATRHVPFLYFHSVIDNATSCAQHVVGLDQLATDLGSEATTPAYSFITPDLCHDGHDATCADASEPAGYAGIDEFLHTWVPRITASPAFQHDGLLLVTFDESDGPQSDATACCNEPAGYNTVAPGISGPGGGRTGAVVLSPFVTPGSTDATPYDHYSQLRSVEDVFGLTHLGYAGQDGLAPFALGDGSPPPDVPQAPYPVLLLLTAGGGLLAATWVRRRRLA